MKQVMVVDDEEDVKHLFQQRFRKEIKQGKIKFHFALSAETALDYLEEQEKTSIVLILSDINMPGMNGLELLEILKSKYQELKVFMISAYGDEMHYKTAVDLGADDYILKPINFEELKQKVLEL